MPKKKNSQPIRVPYALTVFGNEERKAVQEVLKDPTKIVPGERVKLFEQKIARIMGKKFGVMVNSGSSANTLAVESFDFSKGAEIITPALTFATTVAPLLQRGLTPVLADVEEGAYTIDIDALESKITPRTEALMIPLLIGSIPDMARLCAIAKKHGLAFIEDSCDTLGGTYGGKPTGTYSDVSTTSFYASHIITTAGAGGMVAFNDPEMARRAVVKRGWGRASSLFGVHEKSEDLKKRFAGKLDEKEYDAKFVFDEMGYNFQTTELAAAFGLAQLERLAGFAATRKRNFAALHGFFSRYDDFFVLPRQKKAADTVWLAFPLTLRSESPIGRNELCKRLEMANIQTRPIFTGNIAKQPAFKDALASRGKTPVMPVADHITQNGLLIGCHHGLAEKHLAHLFRTFEEMFGARR